MESSRIDTHTPSPIHASCRTWLSLRGWASKDFCRVRGWGIRFVLRPSGLIQTGEGRGLCPHLDLHVLGLDDVDLVLVAAPDFVVHHGHAADGVMRPAEVHEMVVG